LHQVAGLKTIIVDVEPYAAEAAFEQVRSQLPGGALDQCVALIDIGATVMNVNVMRNDQSVYTRDQANRRCTINPNDSKHLWSVS